MITVVATIAPPFTTALTNVATIETSAVETDTTNNTTPAIVNPILAPDLVIDKAGPIQGDPGEMITYTIAYTNIGTALAHQVVLSDVLPAALLTPTFAFSGAAIAQRPETTFVWDVVDLAPDEAVMITVSGTIDPTFLGVLSPTLRRLRLQMRSTTSRTTRPLRYSPASISPDLEIHKTGPATAYPGDIITYTLTYSNTGNASASSVTITDFLPPETTVYELFRLCDLAVRRQS